MAATQTPRSICYHEPIAQMARWQDVERLWATSKYAYCGIADSGLGLHLGEILERVMPRTLLIERSIAEVKASLAKIGIPPTNFCDILAERMAPYRKHLLVKTVAFDDLRDRAVVDDCLAWLMPNVHVDPVALGLLMRMNVQAHMDGDWWASVMGREDIEALFGDAASLIRAA